MRVKLFLKTDTKTLQRTAKNILISHCREHDNQAFFILLLKTHVHITNDRPFCRLIIVGEKFTNFYFPSAWGPEGCTMVTFIIKVFVLKFGVLFRLTSPKHSNSEEHPMFYMSS